MLSVKHIRQAIHLAEEALQELQKPDHQIDQAYTSQFFFFFLFSLHLKTLFTFI